MSQSDLDYRPSYLAAALAGAAVLLLGAGAYLTTKDTGGGAVIGSALGVSRACWVVGGISDGRVAVP